MVNKLFFVLYSSLLISLVPMGAAAQYIQPPYSTPPAIAGMGLGGSQMFDPVAFKSLPIKYQRSISRHMLSQKEAEKRVGRIMFGHLPPEAFRAFEPQTMGQKKVQINKVGRVTEVCSNSVCHNKRRAALYKRVQAKKDRMYGKKPQSTIKYITQDGNINTLYCKSTCTPGSLALSGAISGKDMGIPLKSFAKLFKKKKAARVVTGQIKKLIDPIKPAIIIEMSATLRPKTLEKLDRLFENPMADLAGTNDINLTRALSIPKSQVEASKEEFKDSIRNNEAETDYVKNADEKKQYCLYEGC